MARNRHHLSGLTVALCLYAGAAWSAPSIQITSGVSGAPNIGKVVESSPTSTAIFRVDAASGSVTRTSGTLVRLTGGSAPAPVYTVTCKNGSSNGSGDRCGTQGNLTSVTISVTRITSSGSAFIAAHNISFTAGSSVTCGSISGQNTTTASVTCSVPNQNGANAVETIATVNVGMDITVQSSSPSGAQTLSYTVSTNP